MRTPPDQTKTPEEINAEFDGLEARCKERAKYQIEDLSQAFARNVELIIRAKQTEMVRLKVLRKDVLTSMGIITTETVEVGHGPSRLTNIKENWAKIFGGSQKDRIVLFGGVQEDPKEESPQ